MKKNYHEWEHNGSGGNSLECHKCIIGPGYIVVSDQPAMLCSVCGNGVVVTLWERYRKIGGMAHCIYPTRQRNDAATNYCADRALYLLLSQMAKHEAHPLHMEAQLFGGGSLNGYAAKRANKVIKMIRKILNKFKIDIVSEDIGGQIGRKVIFHSFSGETMVVKTRNIRKFDWSPEYAVRNGDA